MAKAFAVIVLIVFCCACPPLGMLLLFAWALITLFGH
jgi:hypothetical protein